MNKLKLGSIGVDKSKNDTLCKIVKIENDLIFYQFLKKSNYLYDDFCEYDDFWVLM